MITAVIVASLAVGAAACGGRNGPRQPTQGPRSRPAAPTFTATAYCQGTMTADGTKVRRGIVAADPAVLPLGSVIRVSGLTGGLDGLYTVADTGAKVRGRWIDIYMNSCREAAKFGRQRARVTLVRRASSSPGPRVFCPLFPTHHGDALTGLNLDPGAHTDAGWELIQLVNRPTARARCGNAYPGDVGCWSYPAAW